MGGSELGHEEESRWEEGRDELERLLERWRAWTGAGLGDRVESFSSCAGTVRCRIRQDGELTDGAASSSQSSRGTLGPTSRNAASQGQGRKVHRIALLSSQGRGRAWRRLWTTITG